MNIKDLLLSAASALLPAFVATILTFLFAFFVPECEVRFVPSLVSAKAVYFLFENRSASTSSAEISVSDAGSLHVLDQSGYADVKIKIDASGKNADVLIGKMEPSARTTILFASDNGISTSDFHVVASSSKYKVVPNNYLSSNVFTSVFLAGLVVQGLIYFVGFYVMRRVTDSANQKYDVALSRLTDTRQDFAKKEVDFNSSIEALREELKQARNASTKYRLYTRQIYSKIDSENIFWRNIVRSALKNTFITDRDSSERVYLKYIKKSWNKSSQQTFRNGCRTTHFGST